MPSKTRFLTCTFCETALKVEEQGGAAFTSVIESIDRLFVSLLTGVDTSALIDIADSEDPRAAWVISDLLRFFGPGPVSEIGFASFERLTGAEDRLAETHSARRVALEAKFLENMLRFIELEELRAAGGPIPRSFLDREKDENLTWLADQHFPGRKLIE